MEASLMYGGTYTELVHSKQLPRPHLPHAVCRG